MTGVGDDPFVCICGDGFGGDTCNLTETGTTKRKLHGEEKLGEVLHFNHYLSFSLLSGPCSPNPCKNDGLCEIVTPTRRGDVFNEYICRCQPGFEGAHCQISRLLLKVIMSVRCLSWPVNIFKFDTQLCAHLYTDSSVSQETSCYSFNAFGKLLINQ